MIASILVDLLSTHDACLVLHESWSAISKALSSVVIAQKSMQVVPLQYYQMSQLHTSNVGNRLLFWTFVDEAYTFGTGALEVYCGCTGSAR
jgi:hypothetical protein